MSKTIPAIERVGITTPANIAETTSSGNTPGKSPLTFDRIVELAAQHEYGGAAGGDKPREHYFRTGDLAAFAQALLAEAPTSLHPDISNALALAEEKANSLTAILEVLTEPNANITDLMEGRAKALCNLLFELSFEVHQQLTSARSIEAAGGLQ